MTCAVGDHTFHSSDTARNTLLWISRMRDTVTRNYTVHMWQFDRSIYLAFASLLIPFTDIYPVDMTGHSDTRDACYSLHATPWHVWRLKFFTSDTVTHVMPKIHYKWHRNKWFLACIIRVTPWHICWGCTTNDWRAIRDICWTIEFGHECS